MANGSHRRAAELPPGLRISSYDRVAGILVALLVLAGFAVIVLFLLWLAGKALAGHEAPPLELLEERPAGNMTAMGVGQEMVEPGVEQFADIQTPQLADTLAAVTTVVTTQQASLDDLFGDASQTGAGQGDGSRTANGSGGDGDQEIVPRWERFQIQLTSNSPAAHARILDNFNIELGVLGGGVDGITYVSKLAAAQPTTRTGFGDQENRLLFPQDSALRALDLQLLAKANVDSKNRAIVYCLPADVENQLAVLERRHAGQRPLEEIQRTVFGVQSAGDGYVLYVIRQEYRL